MTQPVLAILQGTATADIFIRHYERTGDFGRLALWHEAAAECLKRISLPMNEIAYDYYKQHGYEKWAARAKKEAREIHKRHQYHRTRAETEWQKFVEGVCNPDSLACLHIERENISEWQKFVGGVCNPDSLACLHIERENISKFIAVWLPRYPDRFYEFGIYPTFFRKQRKLAEQRGDYVKALQLEADAAAMCAAQYAQIPITYGLKNYEKHRDAYQAYASRLRDLAQQNPKTLPPEINGGKQILDSLLIRVNASRLKADAILRIAKSDARVKAALAGQNAVHAYPRFQGFAWVINFSNHSRGNLVTVIFDEKTSEVLAVFSPME